MKNKLMVLKGLPASGKSTFAKELEKEGYVRVSKDDIRVDSELFPDGYNFKNKGHEKRVIKERNRIVTEALQAEKNVIVDDTNLNPVHIKDLSNLSKEFDVEFIVNDSFMDVALDVCIERDKGRKGEVGQSVIRSMYHKWIKNQSTTLKYDPNLPMVVICDIDGTLAHMNNKRRPFEWHKVGVDEVDSGVAHLLDAIKYIDYAKVFLFSGRNDVCKKETKEWLERHDIEYDKLYMRPNAQNDLDDRIIKENMLMKYVVGKYNVLFVVDDRPKVCRMWRDKFGLRVLNCGDPYMEF